MKLLSIKALDRHGDDCIVYFNPVKITSIVPDTMIDGCYVSLQGGSGFLTPMPMDEFYKKLAAIGYVTEEIQCLTV